MKFKQDITERRNGVRVDFRVPVEIFCSEQDCLLNGVLVNLSMRGMLLEADTGSVPVAIDGKNGCKARLIFQGKGSRLIIDELHFSVVRQEKNMLAMEFKEALEWFLLFTVYKDKQISS